MRKFNTYMEAVDYIIDAATWLSSEDFLFGDIFGSADTIGDFIYDREENGKRVFYIGFPEQDSEKSREGRKR